MWAVRRLREVREAAMAVAAAARPPSSSACQRWWPSLASLLPAAVTE
jgi:hypothetical protein